MDGALKDILVLDLGWYVAAPFCGTVLADMGAEVIRIEPPGGADDRRHGPFAANGEGLRYLMVCRNRKGITLNLEEARGRQLFYELVKKADVVLENFSPPVKKKLGLTYDQLSEVNPRIILTTVSAFGCDGPYSKRLGFDPIAQAECGSMSFSGFPETPHTRSQVAWVDLSTALHAAVGTLLALLHRMKTGKGQQVEASLIDTAVSFVGFLGILAEYEVLNQIRPKIGNAAFYTFVDTFYAKDGMVFLAALSNPLWKRLTDVIGHPELRDDPRFADDELRWHNRHILIPMVQEWVGQRTREEVFEIMGKARLPCGRVNSIPEVIQDPHIQARELLQKLDVPGAGPMSLPRVAIRMSLTSGHLEQPAPKAGQHNGEVYGGMLGLSPQEIEKLRAEKVI